MKRRNFVMGITAAGIVLPGLGGGAMRAFAHGEAGSPFRRLASADPDRVLVVIRWSGGNDGLNTVVPYHDDDYYRVRGKGTDFDLSIAAESVLPFHDRSSLGFHPSLAPLHALYREGKVAIVENVGYPNQNLSHFRSTDIWLSGSDSNVYDTSGWYARYIEERYPDYPEHLPSDPFAIELDTNLGMMLVGRRCDAGITIHDLSYIPETPEKDEIPWTKAGREIAYVEEMERESNVFLRSVLQVEEQGSSNAVPYPDSTIGRALARVALLITGGLTTQVYVVNVDGFDTHDGHVRRHAALLKVCADAMYAFQRDIEACGMGNRVCMMTISEFGRRAIPNGSGTDHGAAAPMLIIGEGVDGGVIGSDPNVNDLDEDGNLQMENDFRQVYASILSQWFRAADREMYPAVLPRPFAQLPIFKGFRTDSVPADRTETIPLGPSFPNPASEFVTIPFGRIPGGVAARIDLHTADGRQVLTIPVMPGERSVTIDTRGLPSGVYLYELVCGGRRALGRMIVER